MFCGPLSPEPVKSITVRPICNLVAAGQFFLLDALVIDEGAVGAAQVDQQERIAGAADFRMAAGDLGVVQLDGIARVASQVQSASLGVQFKTDALITALDDEERCHGKNPGELRNGLRGGAAALGMEQLFDSKN